MQGTDVLLAFDMGTGKTPTTLWALESLRGSEFKPDEVGVVLAPASLKWQWADEVHRFTDQRAVVIDGTPLQRKEQYRLLRDGGHTYAVMTYDMYLRDWQHHWNLFTSFLVLDEATAIKNYKSKRSRHIKDQRHRYAVRYALTGTPVENGKAEEMFSIMEFIDPKILGKFWAFQTRYIDRDAWGSIAGYRNLGDFHRRISPYVLRASYDDPNIAKHLPTVDYRPPIKITLPTATRIAVNKITAEILDDLDSLSYPVVARDVGDEDFPDGVLMSKIQVLRMILSSPSAVKRSADKFVSSSTRDGSEYASEIDGRGWLDHVLNQTPKLDAAQQYVLDHLEIDPRFKAVVFSTFVEPAQQMVERLSEVGAVLYTGSMAPAKRASVVDTFHTDPSCRVFVSTDAGGYGLNLPEANLLVNLDLPWQAGALKQRNARIRRASSSWGRVIVQDFLVRDSIEERMRVLLRHKTAVANAIVEGVGANGAGRVETDLTSLREFLTDIREREIEHAS